MESTAVTPGVLASGDGVSAVRSATNRPTCKSSTVQPTCTSCIYLNIEAISDLWEIQKNDFLRGHCDTYSYTADEVFAFHLLKIHASYCAESACERGSSSHMIEEAEHSITKVNTNFKLEPNFSKTEEQSMLHNSGKMSSNFLSNSGSDCHSFSYVYAPAFMEQPDPFSHDQVTYNAVALDVKQETDDAEQSEVYRCLGALPEGSLDAEIDQLQEVAMESTDVSHDQRRELGTTKSPGISHDLRSEFMTVQIKTEEGTTYEDSAEHLDEESNIWLNNEPTLATRETNSANRRKMPAKCEDCHKVLQGSRFQYSLDGTGQNIVMKCDTCKRDARKAAELSEEAMDPEADIPRELTNHPTLHQMSRTCRIVEAQESANGPADLQDDGKVSHGKEENSPHLSVPDKDGLQEGVKGNADPLMSATDASCGKNNVSSYLGEGRTRQVSHDDVPCPFSMRIQARKHKDGLHEYRKNRRGTLSLQDCDGSSTCSMGSKSYSVKSDPKTYDNEHSRVKLICKLCPKEFSRKGSLTNHMRTHNSERPFKCHVCSQAFCYESMLAKHMRTHTGEKPFHCQVCSKAFSVRWKLTRHMRSHTDPGERSFTCKICSMAFSNKSNLVKHTRIHTGERPFTCNICYKAFSQSNSLGIHIRTHTGEKPFHCQVCSKAFSDKGNLTRHMRTHTGEQPLSCHVCSKDFTWKDNLELHMRTHTGEKPFTCKICSMAFSQSNALGGHMRMHAGETPFSCHVCSRDFTLKEYLTVHMRTHTDELPFQCQFCSKEFSQKSNLVKHMRTHNGENHTTARCSKAFSRKGNLVKHMGIHTSERPFSCQEMPMK